MDFSYSEEQKAFRNSLRRFLAKHSPSTAVRAAMSSERGYEPALWRRMCGELGLPGVGIPERFGGIGFGFLELGIVFQELGRRLACAPLLGTVLAGRAIMNSGDDTACGRLLPALASGERTATLAFECPGVTATPDGEVYLLAGEARWVLDGQSADLILVAVEAAEGQQLLELAGREGVRRIHAPVMDETRPLAHLRFDGARARPIGQAREGVARTLRQGAVLLANEAAGAAEVCLEESVAFAKERVQFSRPIGSFQAIKHMCAELLLDIQLARATAEYASWAAQEDVEGRPEELRELAPLSKALCSEVFTRATHQMVQIHGGMGFTWEHDAHLYFRRARSSHSLLGAPKEHWERLAALIGL